MKTITKEKASDLDLILKTLIEKKTQKTESVETINEKLFPEKSREYCMSLFFILAENHPRLLYPEIDLNEDVFWATEYVPVFLHDGGFTLQYERTAKIQEINSEIERLNLEKLRYDVKNSKRIFKTYWWTFVISILGFLFALGKIIFDIITKK